MKLSIRLNDSLACLVLLWSTIVSASAYQLSEPQKRAIKAVDQAIEEIQKLEAANDLVEPRFDKRGQVTLKLLEEKKYAELDSTFETLQKEQGHCQKGEFLYLKTSEAFNSSKLMDSIQAWNEKTKSAHSLAYLALAHTTAAWQQRGNRPANKVDQEGWLGFQKHLILAKKILRDALEKNPANPLALRLRITIAMGMNENIDAIETYYLEAAKVSPRCGDYFAAAAYAAEPKWSGSVSSYLSFHEKHAGKAYPDHALFTTLYSLLNNSTKWNDKGGRGDALRSEPYQKILRKFLDCWTKRFPDTTEPYIFVTKSLTQIKEYTQAEQVIHLGLKKHRGDYDLSFHRGEVFFKLRRVKKAIEILKPLRKRNPKNGEVFRLLGVASSDTNNYEKSIEYFDQALKIHEGADNYYEVRTIFDSSEAAMIAKDYDRARKHVELGLKHRVTNFKTALLVFKGRLAVIDGDKKQAKELFNQALNRWSGIRPRIENHHPNWEKW